MRRLLQYFNLDSIQSFTSVFLLVLKKYVFKLPSCAIFRVLTLFCPFLLTSLPPAPPPTKLIKRIRHSARLVDSLPTDLQRLARDSYASSLKSVFILAACASLLAYLCRLPVSVFFFLTVVIIF